MLHTLCTSKLLCQKVQMALVLSIRAISMTSRVILSGAFTLPYASTRDYGTIFSTSPTPTLV